MEGQVLSRMCERRLVDVIQQASLNGWDVTCFRLRFVWSGRDGQQRPDVSHVVLAWEGTAGDRATTRRCLCGLVENPDR
jgi:hypothetical protein